MAEFRIDPDEKGWLKLSGTLPETEVANLVAAIERDGPMGIDLRTLESVPPAAAAAFHTQLHDRDIEVSLRVCVGQITNRLQEAGFHIGGQHPLLIEDC
jgi:hypothetical protein